MTLTSKMKQRKLSLLIFPHLQNLGVDPDPIWIGIKMGNWVRIGNKTMQIHNTETVL
jgi:hypothetical protein